MAYNDSRMRPEEFGSRHGLSADKLKFPQRAAMDWLRHMVKLDSKSAIVGRDPNDPYGPDSKSNPANAMEYFSEKALVAAKFEHVGTFLRDYVRTYGSMDRYRFSPEDRETLANLSKLRDYACGMEATAWDAPAFDDWHAGAGADMTQEDRVFKLEEDIRTAQRARDAYGSILTAERDGAGTDAVYIIRCDVENGLSSFRKGVGSVHASYEFRSGIGAMAYLQSCVMGYAHDPHVTDGTEVRAAYPGHGQLGIAALGHGGYEVEIKPRAELSGDALEAFRRDREYMLYKMVLKSDLVPGGHTGALRTFNLESASEFLSRCDYCDTIKACGEKSSVLTTLSQVPGGRGDDLRKLCQSNAEWSVRKLPGLGVTDSKYGGKFRGSSDVGLNVLQPADGACNPTAHELRNPDEYMDSLRSRAAQARALAADIVRLDRILDAVSNVPAGERAIGGLQADIGEIRDNYWLSPGTQCHQTDRVFPRAAHVDGDMVSMKLASDLAARYVMARYGVDIDSIRSPGAEPAGFNPDELMLRVWNGGKKLHASDKDMVTELNDFAREIEELTYAERSARRAYQADGKPMPFAVTLVSKDGRERKFPVATEAFLERFVADNLGREGYADRACVRKGEAAPERDRLRLSGGFDKSFIKSIMAAAGAVRGGTLDGKSVSLFDGPAIIAAARESDIMQPQAARDKAARNGLDARASEIESNGPVPDGPEYDK